MLLTEEENPWNIQSLYDLQHFNCPTCTYKNNQKQEFINHAYEFHPESEYFLKNIKDDSLNDVDVSALEKVPKLDADVFTGEFDIKIAEEFDNDQDNLSACVIIDSLKLDTYHCSICNSYFCNQNALQLHNDTNHNKLIGNWNESNETFEVKNGDCTKKLKCRDYKCDSCGNIFARKENLKKHIHIVHEGHKDYKCEFCSDSFTEASSLKRHIQRIHDGLDFKCEHCGRSFSRADSLRSHVKRVHEKSPGQCDHCGKEFENELKLKTHVDNVHLKKKVDESEMCQICNKLMKKYRMKVHMKRVHDETSPSQCDSCGKYFKNKTQLKDHVRIYHKEQSKEACVICGKIVVKCYMKNHIKSVHDKVKDFQCATCGKSFSLKSCLKKHSIVHTGDKKEKCPHCGKLFSLRANLSVHIKRHVGIKDQICTYCGKAFTDVKSLRRHSEIVHEGIKRFKCHLCTNAYGQSHELKKHLISFHKKIVPKNRNIFELQNDKII